MKIWQQHQNIKNFLKYFQFVSRSAVGDGETQSENWYFPAHCLVHFTKYFKVIEFYFYLIQAFDVRSHNLLKCFE